MYEIIEIICLWLIAFVISFVLYMILAYMYYDMKLKKIEDMTKDITDDLVKRMGKVEESITELKVDFASVKATIRTWGLIIGFIFSSLTTYVIAINVSKHKTNVDITETINKKK